MAIYSIAYVTITSTTTNRASREKQEFAKWMYYATLKQGHDTLPEPRVFAEIGTGRTVEEFFKANNYWALFEVDVERGRVTHSILSDRDSGNNNADQVWILGDAAGKPLSFDAGGGVDEYIIHKDFSEEAAKDSAKGTNTVLTITDTGKNIFRFREGVEITAAVANYEDNTLGISFGAGSQRHLIIQNASEAKFKIGTGPEAENLDIEDAAELTLEQFLTLTAEATATHGTSSPETYTVAEEAVVEISSDIAYITNNSSLRLVYRLIRDEDDPEEPTTFTYRLDDASNGWGAVTYTVGADNSVTLHTAKLTKETNLRGADTIHILDSAASSNETTILSGRGGQDEYIIYQGFANEAARGPNTVKVILLDVGDNVFYFRPQVIISSAEVNDLGELEISFGHNTRTALIIANAADGIFKVGDRNGLELTLDQFLTLTRDATPPYPYSVSSTPLLASEAPVAPSDFTTLHNVEAGDALDFTIPRFTDPDGDSLTYAAHLEDGSALPNWLTFNAGTRTFSIAEGATDSGAIGAYQITVKAQDSYNTAKITFTLNIAAPGSLPADAGKFIILNGFTDGSFGWAFAEDSGPRARSAFIKITARTDLSDPDEVQLSFAGRHETSFSARGGKDEYVINTYFSEIAAEDDETTNTDVTITDTGENIYRFEVGVKISSARVQQDGSLEISFGNSTDISLTIENASDGRFIFGNKGDSTAANNSDFELTLYQFIQTLGDPSTTSPHIVAAVRSYNNPPLVQIDDNPPSASIGEAWSYQVPAFADNGGSSLSYGAVLANGDALPSWLAFDEATRTFTIADGATDNVAAGEYHIKVIVRDTYNVEEGFFTLKIVPAGSAQFEEEISDKTVAFRHESEAGRDTEAAGAVVVTDADGLDTVTASGARFGEFTLTKDDANPGRYTWDYVLFVDDPHTAVLPVGINKEIITLTATDNGGNSTTYDLEIDVRVLRSSLATFADAAGADKNIALVHGGESDINASGVLNITDVDEVISVTHGASQYGTFTFDKITGSMASKAVAWTYQLDAASHATRALPLGISKDTITITVTDRLGYQTTHDLEIQIEVRDTGATGDTQFDHVPWVVFHGIRFDYIGGGTTPSHVGVLATPSGEALDIVQNSFIFELLSAKADGYSPGELLAIWDAQSTPDHKAKFRLTLENPDLTSVGAAHLDNTDAYFPHKTVMLSSDDLATYGNLAITDAEDVVYVTHNGDQTRYGTFSFDEDTGDWTYAVNRADPDLAGIKAGRTVHETITFVVFDGTGDITTYDLEIDVTAAANTSHAVIGDLYGRAGDIIHDVHFEVDNNVVTGNELSIDIVIVESLDDSAYKGGVISSFRNSQTDRGYKIYFTEDTLVTPGLLKDIWDNYNKDEEADRSQPRWGRVTATVVEDLPPVLASTLAADDGQTRYRFTGGRDATSAEAKADDKHVVQDFGNHADVTASGKLFISDDQGVDSVTYSAPKYGHFVFDQGTGLWKYFLDRTDPDALNLLEGMAYEVITFTITDNTGAITTHDLVIDIEVVPPPGDTAPTRSVGAATAVATVDENIFGITQNTDREISTFAATDADGDTIYYFVDPTSAALGFFYDAATQTVRLKGEIDHEAFPDGEHIVTVTATANGQSVIQEITVTINDIEENPILFDAIPETSGQSYNTQPLPHGLEIHNGHLIDVIRFYEPEGDNVTSVAKNAKIRSPLFRLGDMHQEIVDGTTIYSVPIYAAETFTPEYNGGSTYPIHLDVTSAANDGTARTSAFKVFVTVSPPDDSTELPEAQTDLAPVRAAFVGDAWSYKFPALFESTDTLILGYTAEQTDGEALPNWLHFNAATRTFSIAEGATDTSDAGTAVEISIKAIYANAEGAEVSSQPVIFTLSVDDVFTQVLDYIDVHGVRFVRKSPLAGNINVNVGQHKTEIGRNPNLNADNANDFYINFPANGNDISPTALVNLWETYGLSDGPKGVEAQQVRLERITAEVIDNTLGAISPTELKAAFDNPKNAFRRVTEDDAENGSLTHSLEVDYIDTRNNVLVAHGQLIFGATTQVTHNGDDTLYGTFTLAEGGAWTYTLNPDDPQTNRLMNGDTHEIITFTAINSEGVVATKDLVLNISVTRDAVTDSGVIDTTFTETAIDNSGTADKSVTISLEDIEFIKRKQNDGGFEVNTQGTIIDPVVLGGPSNDPQTLYPNNDPVSTGKLVIDDNDGIKSVTYTALETYGAFTFTPNAQNTGGTWTYMLDPHDADVQALTDAGELAKLTNGSRTVTETITFTAVDNNNNRAIHELQITITANSSGEPTTPHNFTENFEIPVDLRSDFTYTIPDFIDLNTDANDLTYTLTPDRNEEWLTLNGRELSVLAAEVDKDTIGHMVNVALTVSDGTTTVRENIELTIIPPLTESIFVDRGIYLVFTRQNIDIASHNTFASQDVAELEITLTERGQHGFVELYDTATDRWNLLNVNDFFMQQNVDDGHVRFVAYEDGEFQISFDGQYAQTFDFTVREPLELLGTAVGQGGLDGDNPGTMDINQEREARAIRAGIGKTKIKPGRGSDSIYTGMGDDDIDLSAGGDDVVIYRYMANGGGEAVAWDGGDTITGFEAGKDRLFLNAIDDREEESFLDGLGRNYLVTLRTSYNGNGNADRGDLSNYNIAGIEIHFIEALLLPGGILGGSILTVIFDKPIAWDEFNTTHLTSGAFNTANLFFNANNAGKAALKNILGLEKIIVADAVETHPAGAPFVAIGNDDDNVISTVDAGGDWVIYGAGGDDTITLDPSAAGGMEEIAYCLTHDGNGITNPDGGDTITGFTLGTDSLTFVDLDGSAPSLADLLGAFAEVALIYDANAQTYGGIAFGVIADVDGTPEDEAVTLRVDFATALDAAALARHLKLADDADADAAAAATLDALFGGGSAPTGNAPAVLNSAGIALVDDLFGADNISVDDTLPVELL